MAPKKNKSKLNVEAVLDLSTGWRKRKMSEAAMQELENMGLLQRQAVIQWRAADGEDHPYEGTFETVMFCDFVECSACLRILPRPSSILGNPIASSDPTVYLASCDIHPFL